ncbi:GMC oxidoreductase [Cryptosporangium aurantiacum]|uniref:Choline dehydrogenase n=1 Tax=Cryptosporangium aurantiacum TaxID=134849 RepID=A0A1M7R2J3_9ACTN|nr:GMC family oxidoreductase [Cryptosporangium aurantiacum]SHN38860.1 Choline dehydrogenase [Cryptosporangium aurantiacum]
MADETFDAVVIGSGAGGAPVAHALVKAGKRVLVLEKGPLFQPQYSSPSGLSDFKRDEEFATGPEKKLTVPGVANTGSSFYSSHVEPDLNDEPHVYRNTDGLDYVTIEGYTAQVVGGGTQLYGGVSLRYPPSDLRLASANAGRTDLRADPAGDVRREARDWPVRYEDLEPYYTRAEELVGLNGTRDGQLKPASRDHYQPPLEPNSISEHVKTGLEALGYAYYRTPLAVITRDHGPSGRTVPADHESIRTAFVNRYGDPLGLKSNTWVSLLQPISTSSNFELRANCVVTHLSATGSRLSTVHYRDPVGRARTVSGTVVVVACSAIETVRLLQLSAAADDALAARLNGNDLLGRYFLTHCFGGASARVPGRHDKSRTLDSDYATDACAGDDFVRANGLWAGGAIYNNTSDAALPISMARTWAANDMDTIWKGYLYDPEIRGRSFEEYLTRNFGRLLSVAFMANQVPLPTNRISLHPTVRDKWNRPVAYITKGWHSHDLAVMDTLAAQCLAILERGGPGIEIVGSGHVGNDVRRIANHVLGGARFGTDPADSVLDPDCRAWNFDNLYVTDGSFMPTSGGANPTLTIQANAFRVGELLTARV